MNELAMVSRACDGQFSSVESGQRTCSTLNTIHLRGTGPYLQGLLQGFDLLHLRSTNGEVRITERVSCFLPQGLSGLLHAV